MPKEVAPYWNGSGPSPPGTPVRSRISRFEIVNGEIDRDSEEVILDVFQPWEWHNASHLAFGPDGMLYIGSGDGGAGYGGGQSLNDLFGAILRVDVSGGGPGYVVPGDNPFVAHPSPHRDELWAIGLRHPWRFSFDGGEMWIADVGELDYEEVNLGEPGANYGWSVMEGPYCFYTNAPATTPTPTPGPTCNPAGLATPRAYFEHSSGCAIAGGYVYHGTEMPELDGYFIYGDFCSGRIWGVNTADQSAPVLLADTTLHFVSWGLTNQGELIAGNYVRTPGFSGTPGIYKLERLP
jgi:glucose/arabinose dehydrogenase